MPTGTIPDAKLSHAAAKWASSAYGRMFHALYHVPVVVAVPFMTFGPNQEKGKLIPSVILSLLKGGGTQTLKWALGGRLDLCRDVIQGLLDAAIVPVSRGPQSNWGQEQNRP